MRGKMAEVTAGTIEMVDALYGDELERCAAGRLRLRIASEAHAPFLRALFEATWLEAERRLIQNAAPLPAALMELQFLARERAYAFAHPHARDYWVLPRYGSEPIGRILIDWRLGSERPVAGVDLAVDPSARDGAPGLGLLRAWVATCDYLGRSAELHVLPHNPARRLYRRFGFAELDADELPLTMRRMPGGRRGASARASKG
jgi:ribosomal protein S18 acetylase RimI-like enzyme